MLELECQGIMEPEMRPVQQPRPFFRASLVEPPPYAITHNCIKAYARVSTTASPCVRLRARFDFILCRSLDRDIQQQLFFHRSEVQMEPGQAITPGAEVSFSLAPDTQGKGEGNPMAVHV